MSCHGHSIDNDVIENIAEMTDLPSTAAGQAKLSFEITTKGSYEALQIVQVSAHEQGAYSINLVILDN